MKRIYIYLTVLIISLAFIFVANVGFAEECNYSGVYSTNWGDMVISQSGNSVTGNYTYDDGKISGTFSGSTLTGRWSEAPTYAGPKDAGPIEFYFGDDCASFTGVWAYDSTASGWDGDWTGGGKKIRDVTASDLADLEAPSTESVSVSDTTGTTQTDDTGQATEIDTIEDLSAETYDPIQEKYNLPNGDPTPGTGSFSDTADLVPLTGDVFVYRPGQGWRGPLQGRITLWTGDMIYTKIDARAELQFGGASRMLIADRTTLKLPGRVEERGVLERGAINFFNNIRRIINNEPFDFEGGNSISGRKGTDFIMEVDEETQVATYTVNDGSVDVWLKDDPSIKKEVGAGNSVRVTKTGIEDNDYVWDALLVKYSWTNRDLSFLTEVEGGISADSSDDAGDSNSWVVIVLTIVLILAGGAVYYYKRIKKSQA